MAKAKEVSTCIGCKFAVWQLTTGGRIKYAAGRCEVPIPEPVLPLCAPKPAIVKHAIWPVQFIGETCPTRVAK